MLYRPCLIKLVDPDNPENWQYHLREQELPFFITLAHEFLHVLNQLERIDWFFTLLGIKTVKELFNELRQINLNKLDANTLTLKILCLLNKGKISKHNLMDFRNQFRQIFNDFIKGETSLLALFETLLPIQRFLMKKLNFTCNNDILQQKQKMVWENDGFDDSLDEMTVILKSKRQITKYEFVFVGETTFLQEFYDDDSIISWSHYPVNLIKFWKQMPAVLKKDYVNKVVENFGFKNINLLKLYRDSKEECLFQTYKIKRSDIKKTEKIVQAYLNTNKEKKRTTIVIVNTKDVCSEIFVKKLIFKKNVKFQLLPQYIIFLQKK